MRKGDFINSQLQVQGVEQNGTSTPLDSLFSEGITVLKVMRRFGCPLARHEAVQLSCHSQEFARLNVSLVGIGFDTAGSSSFVDGDFWKGRLFVDPTRALYKELDLQRAGLKTTVKCLTSSRTRKPHCDSANPQATRSPWPAP